LINITSIDEDVIYEQDQQMALSSVLQGSHTTASPSGHYLASIPPASKSLRIHATHAPDRFTDVSLRIALKDVTGLQWSNESDRIAVCSAKLIEVIDLEDADHRIRLDNGSGGFGRFVNAEFVGPELLLVVWEFGRAKVWDLVTGRAGDLGEVKCSCDGARWRLRPGRDGQTGTLALLSRVNAEDVLNLYLPASQKLVGAVRLPTTDAQAIEWSPDGRWLAVLDVGTATQGVHFLIPDGNLYRSYPTARNDESLGLGIKSMTWAASGQLVALTRYDGRIVLLNTRTFSPKAVIEHTTIIDQRSQEQQARIWEETVAASGERSYNAVAQPFSPPLTRAKPTHEPAELGVAEAHFSCDGSWLATRDERMLNTVWIWNMNSLNAHAVLVQHSNIRKLHWHPSRADELMLDCSEGIAYLFHASLSNPPAPTSISLATNSALSWLRTLATSASTILATSKASFRLFYPDGQPV
jgi:WD40 repeat protein